MREENIICNTDEEWSKAVRERDNNMCRLVLPGCLGRASESHHIFGRKLQFVRFDIDDGIAVCSRCHRMIEDSPEMSMNYIRRRLRPEVWNRLVEKIETMYGKGVYT